MTEGILVQLNRLKEEGKLVLVEGKKDINALLIFGVSNVLSLEKKPLYEVIEEVASKSKDVVLLVDLDEEGKKLFGKLNSGLQDLGVRVDKRFRNYLYRYTKLRQIEGIGRYVI